jgi:hypothetical protein
VLFDDRRGRFHLRHPQELTLVRDPKDANRVDFVDRRPNAGTDVLVFTLAPKGGDAEAKLAFRNPDAMRREIDADWDKRGVEPLRGTAGWLPKADWTPLKRQVYRLELGVKQPDSTGKTEQRVYIDYYLVLFERNEAIRVDAMTIRNDHLAFRNQTEAVIKSLELGPSPGWVPESAVDRTTAPTRPE